MRLTRRPSPPRVLRLLRALLAHSGGTRTVVVVDGRGEPRPYEVSPARVRLALGGAALVAVGAVGLATWAGASPRADDLRAAAEASAGRADALEDSLAVQAEQVALLRALITGEAPAGGAAPPPAGGAPGGAATRSGAAPGDAGRGGGAAAYALAPRFPTPPPVDGVLSRGFDPAAGHAAVDYAATVGSPVRALAPGRVVLADWTHDGGHTLAVQHAAGYLSVYKHNSRLLRRVGDRVSAQETVALSGDTGRVTSGPHLHVEVWRDGEVRDPAEYVLD